MKKIEKLWGSKLNTLLLLSLVFLAAFRGQDSGLEDKGLLPDKKIVHVGIVVDDIEKALDKWVALLGVEKRPVINIAAGHEDNPTQYHGTFTDAKARIVFIRAENIQIELLEPIGEEKSYWKDFLAQHGPSVHHIGVNVKNLGETYLDLFKKAGYPLVQHGGWNGGEYGYMASQKDLGVVIELLEHYE